MVSSNSGLIDELYGIIDSLNVHKHDAFRTLVFSDTILVYNKEDPSNESEHQYLVMYSIEFAQDLFYRLTGKDTYFRATLRYGEFSHSTLKHIDAYHGPALIDAYRDERNIPATGVFIHKSVWQHNSVFRTVPFTPNYKFVIINQVLLSVWDEYGPTVPLPISGYEFQNGDYPWRVAPDILYFQAMHTHMISHPVPAVRAKHQATWQLYRSLFQPLLDALEHHNFDPTSVVKEYNWTEAMAHAIGENG